MLEAALTDGGVVYVPELSEPIRIADIAKVLRLADAAKTISIEFIGLRPGDKLREDLLSAGECLRMTSHPAIHEIDAPRVSANTLDQALLQLSEIVQRRDLTALLETLCRLVPDHQPSSTVCPAGFCPHD